MPKYTSRLALAGLLAVAAVQPVLAQPGPFDDERLRRIPPPCISAFDVPQVMQSRGYRNARVTGLVDTDRVKVIAENSQGTYLFVFNLCRQEIEDREAL